eukprot:726487_1
MAALVTTQKLTKMSSSHRYAWCIGKNSKGELCIGNKKAEQQLIKCDWSENIKIRNIYTSYYYTLVEDTDGNYYSAGDNEFGACTVKDKSKYIKTMTPITYFKENNLKI